MLIIKKYLFAWLFAALVLACTEPEVIAADISAKAAIVYEPVTGAVLYEKQADEPMLIASTTKIMTAMVVIENCSLDEKVNVSHAHAAVEGSSMYLRPGGEYTVKDLLYGLMLASGNDAAAALADHTAGSMEAFAELMNAECEELGLQNTHFVNSHGLDAEGQYASARDLARITAEAMENPVFREIFASASYSVDGVSYYNHNKLLTMCPGCIGGKTGYTEKAGRILVSCVEREGMRLICVTISDPRDWEDHMELYEQCFAEYEFIPLLEDNAALSVVSGSSPSVAIECEKSGFVAAKSDDVKVKLHLPQFVFSPVFAGDSAGRAEIIKNGEMIGEAEIFYSQTVFVDESLRLSAWEKLKSAVAPLRSGGAVCMGEGT